MKIFKHIILTLTLIIVAFPRVIYAHQSGCHRWHSCPSDTGSYVCGDLGYDTYCGNTNTYNYYEEPDYAADGLDKGSEHARNDSASIVRAATISGESDGYQDGSNDDYNDNDPDATLTCDKTFTFEGYAPTEYQDAYHEAYTEACTEEYDDAYISAYSTAYENGQADYLAEKNDNDGGESTISSPRTEEENGLLWPTLIGGSAVWYGAYLIGEVRKRRRP